MEKYKVLFLDIDGVLNGYGYHADPDVGGFVIDGTRLALIRRIVDATGAKIVLSSSWREHWDKNEAQCDLTGRRLNAVFAGAGLTVFDKTPQIRNDRKEEIIAWLNGHPDVCGFAVIDDSPFEEGRLIDHFVLTSHFSRGIDESDAGKAISILNGTKGI